MLAVNVLALTVTVLVALNDTPLMVTVPVRTYVPAVAADQLVDAALDALNVPAAVESSVHAYATVPYLVAAPDPKPDTDIEYALESPSNAVVAPVKETLTPVVLPTDMPRMRNPRPMYPFWT